MRLQNTTLLLLIFTGTIAAQTQIGGGTCNSSTLGGTYTFTLAGRQISPAGMLTGSFQANGSANFDGANKVTLTMTAATLQSAGSALTYAGTYSVQSNCGGAITITIGDSANFNLLIFNQGRNFLITGTDAAYSYSGGGGTQPATCAAGLLSGVYVFNSTGFTQAGGPINKAVNAGGLIQLDGHNALTVSATYVSVNQNPTPLMLTGTYSLTGGCAGRGTMTDALGNSYTLAFTISGGSAVSISGFDLILSQASNLLFSGSAHAVYGQPSVNAAVPLAVTSGASR